MPCSSLLRNINLTFGRVVEVLDLVVDLVVAVVHLVLLISSFYFFAVPVDFVDFFVVAVDDEFLFAVVSHYDVQYGIMIDILTNDSFLD